MGMVYERLVESSASATVLAAAILVWAWFNYRRGRRVGEVARGKGKKRMREV